MPENFTVDKYDSKTNKLTITYDLSTPRAPGVDKQGNPKTMWMMHTTSGFQACPGVEINGFQLQISSNIGFKKK